VKVRPKITVSVKGVALKSDFISALEELGEIIMVYVDTLPEKLSLPEEGTFHLVLSQGQLKGKRRFSPCPRNWWAPRLDLPERTLAVVTKQPEDLDFRQVLAWVRALLEGDETPWGVQKAPKPVRIRRPLTGWRRLYN